MFLKQANIKNFKSIEDISIEFDKVGGSFAKILVGVNESGKSNILEALSFFSVPDNDISYDTYCNQKRMGADDIELTFYAELDDEEKVKLMVDTINGIDVETGFDMDFSIINIQKIIKLTKESTDIEWDYTYDVVLNTKGLYILKDSYESYADCYSRLGKYYIVKDDADTDYITLTPDLIKERLNDLIFDFLLEAEPVVSKWKPTKEYLLSNVNLTEYKKDIYSNRPLYNIFRLSGYHDKKEIVDAIEKISIARSRSILTSKLNSSINNYVNNIWKDNNIDILIEITETGAFSFLIKDKGIYNEHDRFSITDRSQGAQQILSLIFSLSLETTNKERRNELILIDEPEVHLHPSGVREVSRELMKIGASNYIFMATHSPFMIDKRHRERHYIVKKNASATTEIYRVRDCDNIIDDEVLRDAFGIEVYRDLLNPHSILVEGVSDKILLRKAMSVLGKDYIGITNGHGSNIVTLASKMNHDDMSVMVILDDDEEGKRDKEKIIKIGGVFSEKNVFTIRDLTGEIVNGGTIEDTICHNYVISNFKAMYEDIFGERVEITIEQNRPILGQIIDYLKRNRKTNNWDMDTFKKRISEAFNPTKKSLSKDNPILESLAKNIIERLK
ncbi:MAG: AAA family ATPase [Bacteroidales bacterium]|nr:AAA family ATPase [Bacteroidales bacterium]